MTPPREGSELQPIDHLARAKALLPLVASVADEIEKDRRLPPPLVAALHDGGFFRMLLPRDFGGAEVDPLTFMRVIETIAGTDASTAWILCQTSVTAVVAALLPPEAAREIWRDPRAIVAWGPGTGARAVASEGGFRVTGDFAFASGCWYATWLGGDCAVVEADGTPRLVEGKPAMRRVFFPASRAAMRDLWHVVGLKGTGSDGYSVTDLFVPYERSVSRIDTEAERRQTGPLYALSTYNLFAAGFGALALGIARSLVDSFIALAQEKTPRGFKHRLRNDEPLQAELAHAEARLRAARMYLMGTVTDAWAEAQRDNALSLETRMAIRLASTFVIREAKDVADVAYDAAGATAIFVSNPFERRFRDIHTVAQQLQGRKSHFRTVGQHLLGMEADLGWI